MGIDPRTPIETVNGDEPMPPSEDVDGLVATALSNRPEIRAAQASLRASGYGLNAARSSNAPSVSLSASVGARGPNDPFASSSGTLGIGLNWDIFDGGFSGGAVKSARANVMTAQADLKQATLTAVSDVSQSYVNLKSAEQREAVATTQVANAAELVRLAEGRFRAGVAIFLEVTNAQTALVQAQVNAINAHTAVQQARAQLQRAIGAGVNGLTVAPAPLVASKKSG
jgi:outer membrane protein